MGRDSTPEIERLVEQIRTGGKYATETDVLEAALHLLQQHDARDALKRAVAGNQKSKRWKWAIGFWAVQFLATIAAVAACAADVESIVVTFPALTIGGLTLAQLARPLCSWSVLAYSLSGPLVCALCAALIASNQWTTGEAQVPVLVILLIYACLSVPAALVVFPALRCWKVAPRSSMPLPRQYSLKSLLLATTLLCVALPAFAFLFKAASRFDYIIFSSFVLVTTILVGLSLFAFLAGRHGQTSDPRNQPK